MIRYITAELEITLFETTWNKHVDRFLEEFREMYSIQETEDVDYSNNTCSFICSTNFVDDVESSGSTVAFCLMEDMLDSGFPV